ncbi:MarC family protein [bacterium]|nr:MarC family protein [bacterium]
MKNFLLSFVPFFVAVDAIGVLPIYMGLTGDLDSARRRHVVIQSLITAAAVSIAFLLGGPFVLDLVGVGVSDFMVSGGILLLVISLSDLIAGEKLQRKMDSATLGAVPIGVPLLCGPAVLTTSVLFANQYGVTPTALALLANIALAGIVFSLASPIERILGHAGSKILSKVASLFLASIAVMLIRRGIIEIIKQGLN